MEKIIRVSNKVQEKIPERY